MAAHKNDRLREEKNRLDKEILKLKQEIAYNRKLLVSLYESLASGIITGDEYIELKAGYEKKITDSVKSIQSLEDKQNEQEHQINDYFKISDQLKKISADSSLTKALVEQLIERITVNDKNDISICFKFETDIENMGRFKDE